MTSILYFHEIARQRGDGLLPEFLNVLSCPDFPTKTGTQTDYPVTHTSVKPVLQLVVNTSDTSKTAC